MARIRTVKPAFFRSLTIARLSLSARLTFVGLWTYVDDEGREVDDARLVKAAVWPLDDDHPAAGVAADLDELEQRGLVVRYAAGGRRLLQVTSWLEHQRINRPTPSVYPPPPAPGDDAVRAHGVLSESSVSAHGALSEGSRGEVEGNREKTFACAPAREQPVNSVENPPGVASLRAFRPHGPVENRASGHPVESAQPVDNADSVEKPMDKRVGGATRGATHAVLVPDDLEAS